MPRPRHILTAPAAAAAHPESPLERARRCSWCDGRRGRSEQVAASRCHHRQPLVLVRADPIPAHLFRLQCARASSTAATNQIGSCHALGCCSLTPCQLSQPACCRIVRRPQGSHARTDRHHSPGWCKVKARGELRSSDSDAVVCVAETAERARMLQQTGSADAKAARATARRARVLRACAVCTA